MTLFTISGFDLDAFVAATLAEDLGQGLPGGGHDVTCESVIPADARFAGVMDSRDAITVCGLPIAAAFFRALDPAMDIEILVAEGTQVEPGSTLMRLTGSARAMLTAERSALNTVQHLSGVATLTRQYVDAMGKTRARLLDTRKTIPGLRHLEKYAVRTGGGHNHRMGLWDAAMIKDNHVLVAGGVAEAVRRTMCMTPSPDLLVHEWAKHGACMARTPEGYFRAGGALVRSLRYPDMMALSRRPSLTAGDLRAALRKSTPFLPAAAIRVKTNPRGWLEELHVCYGKDFMPAACADRGADDAAPLKIWRGS